MNKIYYLTMYGKNLGEFEKHTCLGLKNVMAAFYNFCKKYQLFKYRLETGHSMPFKETGVIEDDFNKK